MIKETLQEAFLLKTKGYYRHAIENFYKAIDSEDFSVELLFEIAQCYFFMNNTERALNYIEQILETNPIHIESLKLLKEIFVKKQAWNEAEQTAKNIYSISQNINDLAEVLKFLNKQKLFEEIFEYKITEENPDIFFEKAYAKFHLELLDDALLFINKALDLAPNNTNFLLLKGKILLKNNSDQEAYNLLKKIIFDEENYDILNFYGFVYQRNGEYEKSIKCFSKCLKINKNKDESYYNCASTYFKMGDYNLAKKYYNLAISRSPENSRYHLALANVYYAEKNYKRAYEELKNDTYESRLLKSVILFDSGYHAIAKKEFQNLAKEFPEDDVVANYIQMINEKLKI